VLLNTVLPAMVLTMINQLTNYFTWPAMFEAVIGNASSVLMTLAAVFISYFQGLPSSATIRLKFPVKLVLFRFCFVS
jgi:hypothetical protein